MLVAFENKSASQKLTRCAAESLYSAVNISAFALCFKLGACFFLRLPVSFV